jgi:hypothetical protein
MLFLGQRGTYFVTSGWRFRLDDDWLDTPSRRAWFKRLALERLLADIRRHYQSGDFQWCIARGPVVAALRSTQISDK